MRYSDAIERIIIQDGALKASDEPRLPATGKLVLWIDKARVIHGLDWTGLHYTLTPDDDPNGRA